jgi:putative addiction module antidote
MAVLKLTQIGNSLGVILPKDVLARLRVEKGESLYVVDAPGGLLLTPHDPAFATQMDAARKIMKKRRSVLRELAK